MLPSDLKKIRTFICSLLRRQKTVNDNNYRRIVIIVTASQDAHERNYGCNSGNWYFEKMNRSSDYRSVVDDEYHQVLQWSSTFLTNEFATEFFCFTFFATHISFIWKQK